LVAAFILNCLSVDSEHWCAAVACANEWRWNVPWQTAARMCQSDLWLLPSNTTPGSVVSYQLSLCWQ